MTNLIKFIEDHRDLIEDLIDLLFISTHFFVLHNGYVLVKENTVNKSFYQ
jgi:hypothetical protein